MDKIGNISFGKASLFDGYDYLVFGLMLGISLSIGVYFGWIDKSEKTGDEYLHGSGKMKIVPIAVSLLASQLSSLALMTVPAEMYSYGTQYFTNFLVVPIPLMFVNYIVFPIYYKNGIDNCYAYLELRFNKAVRHAVTLSFWAVSLPLMPIVSFIPALAFAHLSGLNIHFINTVIISICVFYTLVGGIKAVVWTDVVQAGIMCFSVLLVVTMSINKVGGLVEVWNRGVSGHRIQAIDTTFDLTTRQTLWNILFGLSISHASYLAFNQSCVQRIMSLPTLDHAQKSVTIFAFAVILVVFLNCVVGVVMYAFYYDCDPVKAGIVKKYEKMVPYFVHDIVGHLSGMSGLFISSVFSASLSTVSALLNSLAGIIYYDYVKRWPGFTHTEARASIIMKTSIFLMGIFCVAGGFLVEQSHSILQVFLSLAGVTHGSVFGMYLLAMMYPRTNAKGALSGLVLSIGVLVWLAVGSQIRAAQGLFGYPPLPTSLDGCDARNITYRSIDVLNTTLLASVSSTEQSFSIYDIAFPWYCFIGMALVFLFGIPISHFTGTDEELRCVDPALISPLAHSLLPKQVIMHKKLKLDDIYKNTYTVKNNCDDDGLQTKL